MRTLAILMVIVLTYSTTVSAAGLSFAGALRSTGVVLTNSSPLPDGSTVRPGDRITTGPASLARITSPRDGRVEIRAESEASVGAGDLVLERGAAASSKLPIRVGSYTIRPQDPSGGWFAVARRSGRLVIAAHRGSVVIASANAAPIVVNEGSYAEKNQAGPQATEGQPPDQGPQEQDAAAKSKEERKRRAAAAAAGGWTIGGLSHAASVALVVGIGAGVTAAAVGTALALQEEGPSPNE